MEKPVEKPVETVPLLASPAESLDRATPSSSFQYLSSEAFNLSTPTKLPSLDMSDAAASAQRRSRFDLSPHHGGQPKAENASQEAYRGHEASHSQHSHSGSHSGSHHTGHYSHSHSHSRSGGLSRRHNSGSRERQRRSSSRSYSRSYSHSRSQSRSSSRSRSHSRGHSRGHSRSHSHSPSYSHDVGEGERIKNSTRETGRIRGATTTARRLTTMTIIVMTGIIRGIVPLIRTAIEVEGMTVIRATIVEVDIMITDVFACLLIEVD